MHKYCIFGVLYAFWPYRCITVRRMTEHHLNKLGLIVAATSLDTRSTCKLSYKYTADNLQCQLFSVHITLVRDRPGKPSVLRFFEHQTQKYAVHVLLGLVFGNIRKVL